MFCGWCGGGGACVRVGVCVVVAGFVAMFVAIVVVVSDWGGDIVSIVAVLKCVVATMFVVVVVVVLCVGIVVCRGVVFVLYVRCCFGIVSC